MRPMAKVIRRVPMPSLCWLGGTSRRPVGQDQDNALFFTQGEPEGREDRWFGALGTEMNDI